MIKSPPRPAGGRGRREKRDGSTKVLVGDEEGMLYFGGMVFGLGSSRVEREVGSVEGESGAAAAGRTGLGDNVGRAHCGGVQVQQITEAGLMEASTAPRHGDAPSNAELLPAGEASRALLHKSLGMIVRYVCGAGAHCKKASSGQDL
ncbi:hypothetical protein C6P46_004122 [Rhodotorula mucilaginosa]|uniref:Uncharacterized protein n=1 Tax=Rhodotorula mucilaginosa TaxID=5537 RepID=A0A9P7B6B8_RHOMI|nr:hypothetical protein C6P46_004122 [Rhodotorula mucilaginosa]